MAFGELTNVAGRAEEITDGDLARKIVRAYAGSLGTSARNIIHTIRGEKIEPVRAPLFIIECSRQQIDALLATILSLDLNSLDLDRGSVVDSYLRDLQEREELILSILDNDSVRKYEAKLHDLRILRVNLDSSMYTKDDMIFAPKLRIGDFVSKGSVVMATTLDLQREGVVGVYEVTKQGIVKGNNFNWSVIPAALKEGIRVYRMTS